MCLALCASDALGERAISAIASTAKAADKANHLRRCSAGVSVTANTASLARGASVVEWYRSQRDGLEQGFTLLTPPPTGGDLLIVGTFATRLQPDGVSAREDILFRDPVTGRGMLRYSQAWAEDRADRRLLGTLELRGHQIAIRLPAAWLAQAVYPVTVDPLLENDLIFADSFESGDFSAWTSVYTDSGDLSVSTAAALVGAYGMQVHVDDTATMSVRDYTPASEPRYRSRFYFDPNTITMAEGDAHLLLAGKSDNGTDMFRVWLRRSSGVYQVRANLADDGTAYPSTGNYTVTDGLHFLETDWRRPARQV